MSKTLKRVVSALLVAVMVLAMLPTFSMASSELFDVTPIDGVPDAAQPFVIYAASAGVVAGAEASGGKTSGYAAEANEENKNLKVGDGTGVYKLVANSDGSYYLTCGGKYYTASSTSAASFTASPAKGSKWKIEKLGDGYRIANTDFFYQSNPACLEVYNSAFSPYGYQETSASIYTMSFYAIDETAADPDGDGYVGTKPVAQPLPNDGDKVVIYNEYGSAVMGPQSDDATAPSLEPITSTLDDAGNINVGNGGLIFTVHKSGEYYTFENKGTFLRTSENAEDGSNAECLYFDTVESDYTQWRLEEVTGGYVMYNKAAKYKKNSVCIEFFSNSFSGWTYNGSMHLFAMNFYKVEDAFDLGYVLNPKVNITANDAFVGVDYDFSFVLDELTAVKELKAVYSLDGGAEKALTPAQVDTYSYTATIPMAELAGKSNLTVTVSAKNEYDMEYSATETIQIKDEPLIVSVSPLPNAATLTEKRPEVSAQIANCGSNPTIVMTIDGVAVQTTATAEKVSYKAAENMADGRHVVELKITRADGKKTEMTWSFFVGEAGMSLYFGQIHSHTAQYSDGAGTLADAYEHAMKANDVDFLIVTDHSNYFDTTSTATTTSYYDLSSLSKGTSLTKWEEAKATAAEYDAKSTDFVAAYGYEMTWSGGPGHTNTFNTYGTVSRNNASLNEKSNSYAGMHLYNDLMVNANNGLDVDGNPVADGVKTKWIEDAPVVSQFNHPGTTFGTFDDYAGYTPTRDVVLNLIEVGNGEGAVGGSSYWPSYSEYDKCLAKGWHVAPTNNQDNHKGKWGDSNTCRDVIVTDDFTETGLYKAMAERRVYATEDQNLRIYYYLNDQIMGTIIDTGVEEVKTVHITASISDPDGEKLGKIEIIGENGLTLKSFTASGSTYELDTTLDNTDAYYYLKVTQADGDIAVTAPVWMGAATPITCEVKTNAALSVVGDSETITATIVNGATKDYNLSRVRFAMTDANGNETTIKTFKDGYVVKAGENMKFDFDYERTTAGEQEIKVIFYGTYEGKNFKCQATMKQDVADPKDLTNVGVDFGHDNYYISGDYSSSASNFIDFCAENGVKCKYINAGEFTYENLKNFKMIVLTVNYLRNTKKAKDYTDEEIDALKRYVAEGGNVIICSKSDRDNTFDNCAENSNKLLEAIGAHSRVVNGIIVDNDLKANEAYRIYFSSIENFNVDHRFMVGAYTASNAFGTRPATDNQTGFQLYNGAPIEVTDADKVEVLVKGYDSTWGSHYDGYFTGGSFVPNYDEGNSEVVSVKKGDVNIVTYEDLPGGGWVVTSGVTFFSNFDIKSDVDYVNKYFLKNILRDLTGSDANDTISEISKVKAVPESRSGEQYTIEGYVTSNASAYDQDTAFFDCIYVQDKKGNGINVFPVSGNYAIGMNVRCHGGVTYYCGEVELNLGTDYKGTIRVVSDETYVVKPKVVPCKEAMSNAAIGNLMKVGGIVTSIHKTAGVIDKIYVRDTTGEACLFINGYIMKDYHGLDNLQIGMTVTGVGIGSRDVDETSATSAIFARLRVRDRSEIKIVNSTANVLDVFDDVSSDAWYAGAVEFTAKNGLLNGTSSDTFEPNSTLNRAMVATVLHRLAGTPKPESKSTFKDVADGQWYSEAVAWAAENGIVNGYGDGTFKPTANISREEMAVMLVRYAKNVAGVDVTPKGDLNGFADGASVASWAKDSVIWTVDAGIINGMGGKIAPKANATRAEFATIVMRFAEQQN